MIAVDTNVVVRLLTGDDARQTERASALFRTDEVWLSKSVILETEWVLRSLYHFRGRQLSAAMLALTSLPTVRVEDPAAVSKASKTGERPRYGRRGATSRVALPQHYQHVGLCLSDSEAPAR